MADWRSILGGVGGGFGGAADWMARERARKDAFNQVLFQQAGNFMTPEQAQEAATLLTGKKDFLSDDIARGMAAIGQPTYKQRTAAAMEEITGADRSSPLLGENPNWQALLQKHNIGPGAFDSPARGIGPGGMGPVGPNVPGGVAGLSGAFESGAEGEAVRRREGLDRADAAAVAQAGKVAEGTARGSTIGETAGEIYNIDKGYRRRVHEAGQQERFTDNLIDQLAGHTGAADIWTGRWGANPLYARVLPEGYTPGMTGKELQEDQDKSRYSQMSKFYTPQQAQTRQQNIPYTVIQDFKDHLGETQTLQRTVYGSFDPVSGLRVIKPEDLTDAGIDIKGDYNVMAAPFDNVGYGTAGYFMRVNPVTGESEQRPEDYIETGDGSVGERIDQGSILNQGAGAPQVAQPSRVDNLANELIASFGGLAGNEKTPQTDAIIRSMAPADMEELRQRHPAVFQKALGAQMGLP